MYRTERLCLVPIDARHAPELWELHQDEGIARWYPLSRERALRFAERIENSWTRGVGKWLAYEESTGAFVGRGGPSWAVVGGTECGEIGWAFRQEVWGRGYATEIGRAGLDHAFSVPGVEEVVAFTEVHNARSRAVMERLRGKVHALQVPRRGRQRKGGKTVTGKNGAHLRRIEWEGLQDPWEVGDLAESPVLPAGSQRVELRRDEQYRIGAKIVGTWDGASGNLLPNLGETGTIVPDYRIEGSSHRGGFRYELDHCVVSRVSTKGTDLEAELKTYRVRKTAARGRGPRAWLTEWYLNAHDKGLLFTRSVQRELKETYRRDREYPEEMMAFEGQWNQSSGRYVFVETLDLAFALELVPKGLGPGWCRGLAIEYRDEWGGVPEDKIRSIANAVSFVMGRPLISVGHTAFDEIGRALEEVAVSPLQKDLVSVCRAAGHELSGDLLGLLHGCCTRLRRLRRRLGPSKEQKYPTRALLLSFCSSAPRVSNSHDIACLSTRTTCGGEAPR